MQFIKNKEKKKINSFLKKGYIIAKVENKSSLNYINSLILRVTKKIINKKKFSNLDLFHNEISIKDLNEIRINILHKINQNKKIRFHYFNLAREALYTLVGNELMMQKNINLSIQTPKDDSSLLPIHSDVWSGDSAYEINLWLPLVNCYKTKSMYILEQKYYDYFLSKIKKNKIKSSAEIFDLVKDKVKWLNVKYGEYLIFNQALPHGNIVNKEKETRWSMNCRFKSLFSPYEDKKVGEFFSPITVRAMTEIGMNYVDPFKN